MTQDKWIWTLTFVWAACFAMSFGHTYLFEQVGDGMTRAMATLGIWVLWQIGAMVAAIAAFVLRWVTKDQLSPWPRRIGIWPLIISAALWIGTAAWLTYDLTREFA